MPIAVECPSCRSAFKVGEDYAGKRGRCPRCREPIVVPAAPAPVPAEEQEEGLVPIDPPAPRAGGREAQAAAAAEEESEGYGVAGAARKVRAAPLREGGSKVMPEGVARAAAPSRPTQTPKQILASFRGEIEPVRPTPMYRVWVAVVAGVMVLLPLAYVALVGLVAYGVYLHAIYDTKVLEGGRNGKAAVALYFGPIVAGVVVVAFMIKPIFARSGKGEKSRALDPEVEPLLFAFVDGVCTSVGAPRPRRIEVNCEVNASAHRDGGPLAVLSDELVLTIGLPLAAGLTLKQFAGVLAHEFGHFAQGAGMRVSVLIRTINFWFARVVYERDSWDQSVDSWLQSGNSYGILLGVVCKSAVWLTRRVLWVLMYLGHMVSGFLSRQMEYDADRYQARMVGGKVLASTLWRLRELALAESGAYVDLQSSWQEKRLPDNLPRLILANVAQVPAETMAEYRKAMGQAKTGVFDTHPSDRDRIACARADTDEGIFHLDGPATDLFRNFESLARAATFDRYRTLLGPEIRKEQLFTVAELVEAQAVTKEGHQAFSRYFLEAYHPTQRLPLEWNYPRAPADPKAARQSLASARKALEGARRGNLAATKIWETQHERAIVVGTACTLLKANNTIKAADFGLSKPTLKSAESARDEVAAELTRLDEMFAPFATAGARRLSLALSLLELEAVSGRVPDGAARRDEVRALYTVVAHLGDRVVPELPAVQRDVETLVRLLNALEQSKSKSQEMINACIRAAGQLHDRLDEFRWKIGDTLAYPFEHAREDATLAGFALPRVPDKENIGELLQAAQEVLERVPTLFYRALGRLTVTAEEVERALGLPPLEPPAPEETDDEQG